MYIFPDYIKNNQKFLQTLAKTKSEKKKDRHLKEADFDKILAIAEIFLNVLKGRIPLKNHHRKKLSKNAEFYRQVVRSRTEKTARSRLQKGGSVTALSAILIPVLGALGQALLDKTLKKIDS